MTVGLRRLRHSPPEDLEGDLLEHLLTGCVLLLLHETSATLAQLEDALAAAPVRDYLASLQPVLDAMEGDPTLFARQDSIEESWRIVEPILTDYPKVVEYDTGSWGPAEAADFLPVTVPGGELPERQS